MTTVRSGNDDRHLLDLWLCPRDQQPPIPTDEATVLPVPYLLAGTLTPERSARFPGVDPWHDADILTAGVRLRYRWLSRPRTAVNITTGREYVAVFSGVDGATWLRGVAPCLRFITPGEMIAYPVGGIAVNWYYSTLSDAPAAS